MKLAKHLNAFGLSVNAKKTQVMDICRHTSSINIMYNGAPLEQVTQFIYIGSSFNETIDTIIYEGGEEESSIAKRANGDLYSIWRNRELPIPLKRRSRKRDVTGPGKKYGEEYGWNQYWRGEETGRRKMKEVFSGCDRGNQGERDDVCGRLHC